MILWRKSCLLQFILTAYCFALLFTSCVTVKNPPPGRPFVFENKITVNGPVDKHEKKQIAEELDNYWADSLKVPRVQQFGFKYVIKNPPVFDSSNIYPTRLGMNAYLNAHGYYYAAITPSYDTILHNNQQRVKISVAIGLGKRITIDSIGFMLMDSSHRPIDSVLQNLTIQAAPKSFIKKGMPYTKSLVSDELDRLVEIYRKNGFYKITRDDIYAEADTLDARLLKLSLDPIDQARIVEEAAKSRMENPKWHITIMQRPVTDTTRVKQYYIGNIYYYPDTRNVYYNPDSIILNKQFKEKPYRSGTIRYTEDLFRFRPLREHTYTTRGSRYSDSSYYKSINAFSRLGTWKEVDAKVYIRDNDSLDIHYFLIPALKQNYTVNLEGSNNTGGITAGNLLGLATNFSYRNRNVGKQAIQSLTSLRAGVELNLDKAPAGSLVDKPFVQTQQFTLSHTYSFPRWVYPRLPDFLKKKDSTGNVPIVRTGKWENSFENRRTILSLAGSYTNRIDFYQLRSFNFNYGIEGTRKTITYHLTFPNVELYKVDTLDGLINLFKNNPFLRNSFRNGNVLGISFSAQDIFTGNDPRQSHNIRFYVEESGYTITSLIPSIIDKVFAYVKLEGEYRYVKKRGFNELALRAFVGAALPKQGQSIPVFKQYSAGGPNSMRAWGIRQLGLGSSWLVDTSTSGYTDRFADFNLEGNIEYRFRLASISGIKIGSALYADIGNVWNIRPEGNDDKAVFKLNRFFTDIAIGVGTGLRFDFNYFIVRFDFAYKLKDPARLDNNGWANLNNFQWTNTRTNGVEIKNYALQFGIGLPF